MYVSTQPTYSIFSIICMLQGYPISSSIWSRCCNRRNDSQQSSLNTCYYNHNASGNDAIDTTQEVLRSNFEAKTDTPPVVETHTDAKYLLIVEKQGIFLRLCEDAFHRLALTVGFVCEPTTSPLLYVYASDVYHAYWSLAVGTLISQLGQWFAV